jgi:hypothetical protein
MTQIVFLGSAHHDPSGKKRLQRALQKIAAEHSTQPEFIGLEWAHATYTALAQMRSALAERFNSADNKLKKGFIIQFADTLCYEPDLQQELAPPPRLIWMLDRRYPDDISIPGAASAEAFISSKIANLTDWLLPKIPNWERLSVTALLDSAKSLYSEESIRLANLADPDSMQHELTFPQKLDREMYMFGRLRNALVLHQNEDRWGIVIIGEAHLLDVPGSLYNCCLKDGFAVERIWPHEQEDE